MSDAAHFDSAYIHNYECAMQGIYGMDWIYWLVHAVAAAVYHRIFNIGAVISVEPVRCDYYRLLTLTNQCSLSID